MHLVKTLLAAGLLLSATAQAQNVLDFPQPKNNPEEFYAVTEIPAGGIIKYETDAKTGFLIADRFQSMPVAYPANYGSLTLVTFSRAKWPAGWRSFPLVLRNRKTGFGLPFRVSRLSDRWRLTARILVIMKRICAGLSSTIAAGEAVLADVC